MRQINMTDEMSPRGRNKTTHAEDVIRAAQGVDDPCFSVDEVRQRLAVSDETVRQRLDDLAADDVLDRKKVGNAWVYWFPGY